MQIIDKHEFIEEFCDAEEMIEACRLETQIMRTVKGWVKKWEEERQPYRRVWGRRLTRRLQIIYCFPRISL